MGPASVSVVIPTYNSGQYLRRRSRVFWLRQFHPWRSSLSMTAPLTTQQIGCIRT